MNLLVCSSEYYPKGSGIANVAYNVVKELEKKGINCTVCSPTGPDIKIGNVGEYGRLSLIYFWYKVSRYFKDKTENYDMVWLHNPLFIGKNPFNKYLVTIHSTPNGKIAKRIYPWHLHFYYLIASQIDTYCFKKLKNANFTVVDPLVQKELINIGINKKKILYIPNGVDINLFKPKNDKYSLRKRFKLSENDKIILSLGRLNAHKQPLELIRIFSKLTPKTKNITLVIGGMGELFKKAKDLAKEENLDNVKFLGYVDHKKEAPELYACSDYYIMTSIYEGQPLTLLEAMASGLKCIVSDIPNLKKVVEDANCGISINIHDEEAAARNIVEYIKFDNSIHSTNAREYAVQNFNWEIIVNQYLEKFQKM